MIIEKDLSYIGNLQFFAIGGMASFIAVMIGIKKCNFNKKDDDFVRSNDEFEMC
jgi:hypothetical protein